MVNFKYLNVRIVNRVGWIEYNRPSINAFNWEMLREVPAALETFLKNPEARIIVIGSAIEKYFSTGADIRVFDGIDAKGIGKWVSICHDIEYENAVKLAGTKDFSEGIQAFLEKRKPDWD